VWNTGGMILTEENWRTHRKICPIGALSHQIPYGPTWDQTQTST